MNIYLAGKIGKNDWRHSIVDGLREADWAGTECAGTRDVLPKSAEPWPILRESIFGLHNYTGPYFIGCDHGCSHGENVHGCADESNHGDVTLSPESEKFVFDQCIKSIQSSQLVFSWHSDDQLTCYGTIFELGYAKALGKRLIWSAPEPHDCVYPDGWFMLQACEKRYGNNPREILAELLCICLKPKGCVYFIESVGVGHIKIGWTSGNPEQRLKALQTGSGCRLELIGSIAGEQHLETKLHQYFGHLRHNGEWFHGTNELREYIVKHAKLETANA